MFLAFGFFFSYLFLPVISPPPFFISIFSFICTILGSTSACPQTLVSDQTEIPLSHCLQLFYTWFPVLLEQVGYAVLVPIENPILSYLCVTNKFKVAYLEAKIQDLQFVK